MIFILRLYISQLDLFKLVTVTKNTWWEGVDQCVKWHFWALIWPIISCFERYIQSWKKIVFWKLKNITSQWGVGSATVSHNYTCGVKNRPKMCTIRMVTKVYIFFSTVLLTGTCRKVLSLKTTDVYGETENSAFTVMRSHIFDDTVPKS